MNVAQHLGMPSSAVPALVPPLPPAPPLYCASASPDPTPEAYGAAASRAYSASVSPHTHGASPSHAHPASASFLGSNSRKCIDNAFDPAMRTENPQQTLERIAHGFFYGYGNGNTSAGGSFSPNLNDDLPPF
ncbi:hypothetical protein ACP4OV_015262 [Aristida adscensionis]